MVSLPPSLLDCLCWLATKGEWVSVSVQKENKAVWVDGAVEIPIRVFDQSYTLEVWGTSADQLERWWSAYTNGGLRSLLEEVMTLTSEHSRRSLGFFERHPTPLSPTQWQDLFYLWATDCLVFNTCSSSSGQWMAYAYTAGVHHPYPDAEEISPAEISLLAEMVRRWKWSGLAAWAATVQSPYAPPPLGTKWGRGFFEAYNWVRGDFASPLPW